MDISYQVVAVHVDQSIVVVEYTAPGHDALRLRVAVPDWSEAAVIAAIDAESADAINRWAEKAGAVAEFDEAALEESIGILNGTLTNKPDVQPESRQARRSRERQAARAPARTAEPENPETDDAMDV